MFDLYTAVILITILFLMITVADVTENRLITKVTKVRAVIVCALIAASALGECIGVLTNGAPTSYLLLHKIAKIVEFCFAPAIGVAAAIAYGDVKRPKIPIALCTAHALFECVAMRFEWVFRIDSQNVYHRQALYMIYVTAFVLSILYGFFCIIRNGKAYQIGIDSVLILTFLMLMVGISLQFLNSNIRVDYLCIAVGNMLLCVRFYSMMLQVDAVTRLLNRRCYDVNIADMDSPAVVLFLDVDKFKQVNDTYGHSVGDICLRNVAQLLRNVYGKYGLCYRTGGDEFCVILHSGIENVVALNRQFGAAIQTLQTQDSRMPGVSMGWAYYDAVSRHIQDVIEEADAMLYRNKKHGNDLLENRNHV